MTEPGRPDPGRLLARAELFRGLAPESLRLLSGHAVLCSFSRGQRIFDQDEPVPGLYCVTNGLVRVLKLAPGGKEHILHFAEPGTTFGEVAVIGDFPAPACAEALEPTTCVMLPAEQLRALLRHNHPLCLQLLGGMASWVRSLVGLLEDVVLRDASGRVARYLVEAAPTGSGFFQLRMMKRDLASHLNLTSETLSRTLRRLTLAGLIELGEGHRLRILNRSALGAVAQGLLPAEFAQGAGPG